MARAGGRQRRRRSDRVIGRWLLGARLTLRTRDVDSAKRTTEMGPREQSLAPRTNVRQQSFARRCCVLTRDQWEKRINRLNPRSHRVVSLRAERSAQTHLAPRARHKHRRRANLRGAGATGLTRRLCSQNRERPGKTQGARKPRQEILDKNQETTAWGHHARRTTHATPGRQRSGEPLAWARRGGQPRPPTLGADHRCAARRGRGTPRSLLQATAHEAMTHGTTRRDGHNVPSETSGGCAEGSWLHRHEKATGGWRGATSGSGPQKNGHLPTARPTGGRHNDTRGQVARTATSRAQAGSPRHTHRGGRAGGSPTSRDGGGRCR